MSVGRGVKTAKPWAAFTNMTHGPGVKNASRRAERFWPDDRRHKQSLGAVYTASAVYMLGYQQIHQLVSVDFLKKRSSSGFPETQVCVCLRCSGMQVGGASLQAWPEGLCLSFFFPSSSSPQSHTRCHHITLPSHIPIAESRRSAQSLCARAHQHIPGGGARRHTWERPPSPGFNLWKQLLEAQRAAVVSESVV